jgi:hypothetical protein
MAKHPKQLFENNWPKKVASEMTEVKLHSGMIYDQLRIWILFTKIQTYPKFCLTMPLVSSIFYPFKRFD